MALVTKKTVFEDTDITFLGAVRVDSSNTLQYAVQADFTAIQGKVFNGATQVGATMTIVPADVIINTPFSGGIWEDPDLNCNFKKTVSRTYFADPNVTYTVEFKFTLASGYVFWAVFEVTTHPVAGE